eukprot:c12048_g1_i1.p1 GENE.c12048_g1_i1~~c12048_g1_i1.p1  ORF type:complete len:220 (+),score=101.39 c12048_g1_i1:32-661(+)
MFGGIILSKFSNKSCLFRGPLDNFVTSIARISSTTNKLQENVHQSQSYSSSSSSRVRPFRFRTTDPSAPYHPIYSASEGEAKRDLFAYVVRMIGTLKDGSHVYEHIKVTAAVPVSKASPQRDLSIEEKEQIRQLRYEDPDNWTQRKLAKEFGVTGKSVATLAPAPQWKKEQHLTEQKVKTENRSTRKSLQKQRFEKKILKRQIKKGFMG